MQVDLLVAESKDSWEENTECSNVSYKQDEEGRELQCSPWLIII